MRSFLKIELTAAFKERLSKSKCLARDFFSRVDLSHIMFTNYMGVLGKMYSIMFFYIQMFI